MRLRTFIQSLAMIIFLCSYFVNVEAADKPIYMCPNISDIKIDEDGYAYAKGGWSGIALFPEEWKDTWQKYVSSVLYTQPLYAGNGLTLSCQYFTTPLSNSYGNIRLSKSTSLDYDLYSKDPRDTGKLGNCSDAHFDSTPNEKICYWATKKL